MTVRSDTSASDRPASFGDPLSIELANTRYASRGRPREALQTPAQLSAWLHGNPMLGRGLVPEPAVGPADLAAFIGLREAIRSLMQSVVERRTLDPTAVDALNAAAATAPRWPVLALDDTGCTAAVVERSHATPASAALGVIARDAVELLGGARHDKVRACRAPGCTMFFVQNNPRREFCCAACGNRARVSRHYRQHRTTKRKPDGARSRLSAETR